MKEGFLFAFWTLVGVSVFGGVVVGLGNFF
jgi:hypothetical protein